MVWFRCPTEKGKTTWTRYSISAKDMPGTAQFSHGLGFGDINGDGRGDVVIKQGWWEAPADPTQPDWVFHPAEFGLDCAQMYVMDVNSDGYADVISSSAHTYGMWWYEQGREPRSEEHTSELQSLMRTPYAVFCLKKKNKLATPRSEKNSYYNKNLYHISLHDFSLSQTKEEVNKYM